MVWQSGTHEVYTGFVGQRLSEKALLHNVPADSVKLRTDT